MEDPDPVTLARLIMLSHRELQALVANLTRPSGRPERAGIGRHRLRGRGGRLAAERSQPPRSQLHQGAVRSLPSAPFVAWGVKSG